MLQLLLIPTCNFIWYFVAASLCRGSLRGYCNNGDRAPSLQPGPKGKKILKIPSKVKGWYKAEAINKAIEQYIHQEKIKALLALEGTGGFMTLEELMEMREMELRELEPNHASE